MTDILMPALSPTMEERARAPSSMVGESAGIRMSVMKLLDYVSSGALARVKG